MTNSFQKTYEYVKALRLKHKPKKKDLNRKEYEALHEYNIESNSDSYKREQTTQKTQHNQNDQH